MYHRCQMLREHVALSVLSCLNKAIMAINVKVTCVLQKAIPLTA